MMCNQLKNFFQGSHAILVNDYDIYSREKSNNFNVGCRVYYINGNTTGILSKKFF